MKSPIDDLKKNGRSLGPNNGRGVTEYDKESNEALSTKSDRTWTSVLSFIICLNFAASLFALLLETVTHAYEPSQIASHFINTFVYSNCIGSLLGFTILNLTPSLKGIRFPLDWLLLAILVFPLCFAGVLLAGSTLMAIGVFGADDYSWLTVRRMSFDFLVTYIISFGVYFYETVRLRLKSTAEQLRTSELEEERAQKLAIEASLSSLESRVHPHFLFNTLNSISSLIQTDPILAERMIEQLAALLRYSLYSDLRRTIPLEQELKIVRDYLEIERARFGPRLQYEWDVPVELKTTEVPPFVVQTLVENSVKHGISRLKNGGKVRVKVRGHDDLLTIEVRDNGFGFTNDSIREYHGIDNLRQRLSAMFENRAGLEILRQSDFTVVRIHLPERQELEVVSA